MANNVSIDNLANAISNAVRDYTENVSEAIGNEVDSTADKILEEVKRTAPKHSGEYARTFVKMDKSLPGNRRYYVWNRKHYRRVHLLEFGHNTRNGKRVTGKAHLRPAHDKFAEGMVSNIKRIIQNGG